MPKYSTYIITKSGERLDFILDCAQRKKYALAISEGKLTVRAPKNYSTAQIMDFLDENMQWIKANLARSAEKSGLPQTFSDGEKIRLLGEELVITYVLSNRFFPARKDDGRLLVAVCENSDNNYVRKQVMDYIIELAQNEVRESMDRLTAKMQLYPKKVTLKDLKASWGRCSSDGRISINYKVITFPKAYVDYVCIHELSHLVHMDHSSQFWALVGRYCPDWKNIRQNMK